MDFSIYRERRAQLLRKINAVHADKEGGVIVLFADFENDTFPFRQESSFYYYTGLKDPGLVLVMDRVGKTTLYIPNCGDVREKWVKSAVKLSSEMANTLCVDEVAVLGDTCPGYQLHPFFGRSLYENLVELLAGHASAQYPVFTMWPITEHGYIHQRLTLSRLAEIIPDLGKQLVDISPLAARMRRIKEKFEVECLYKAVETTMLAHEAAARAISDGIRECEVQAHLEFMMAGSCQRPSFPSIVASGASSTILHYLENDQTMRDGDLVVVDIGAEYEHYCGDLTRTYPVSGQFTERQREIYDIVLDTQEYIAGIAKPGLWLSNKQKPESSLHHLAIKFLSERGYADYFPHGVGHYLGLDVHDVGDYETPLEPGDVITIEPGIYISREQLGVRIEDNYWMVEDGLVCLSDALPKKAEEVEKMVQRDIEDGEREDDASDYDDIKA